MSESERLNTSEREILESILEGQARQLTQLTALEQALAQLLNKLEKLYPEPQNEIPVPTTKVEKVKEFLRFIVSFSSVTYFSSLITIAAGMAYLITLR